MTISPLARQTELPRSVPLFRYAPKRVKSILRDLDPSTVRTPEDLPQYLIVGNLDPSGFEYSAAGWTARWQGTEEDTHFDVAYKAAEGRYEIRQTWRGLDGGSCFYSTRVPLDQIIGRALYLQFPSDWDHAAKLLLEAEYQLTVIEQPENLATFCGLPDGALRTIAFPIAVSNLRPVRQWLQESISQSQLTYPVCVEAKLVFQALNYLEGKAPGWTAQEAVAFNQSVIETGLAPQGFPLRELTNDGPTAWTLRREIYYVFISLPFAGLTDFLQRMASENGPIRTACAPDLRFELRPVVLPAAFDIQTESMSLWDRARTTRLLLRFAQLGEEKAVATVEQTMDAERNAEATLANIEAISSEVVTTIKQIFQSVTARSAP